MLGVHRLDRASHRLRHHNHTRAAAERIIVALQMLILRIVANIYHVDLQLIALDCPPDNTFVKRRKHLGEER